MTQLRASDSKKKLSFSFHYTYYCFPPAAGRSLGRSLHGSAENASFDQMRARLQIETPCNLSLILHTLAMKVLNKARYLHNNRDRLMSPVFLFCRSDPRRFGLLKRDKMMRHLGI